MRIFKIELPAAFASVDPNVSLAADGLREQLHRELDAVKDELAEGVRRRAATYFPPDYTVFVRFLFPADSLRATVTIWVDDPNVRWPSGLFARRAWSLSIPIVTHIVKETFEARVRPVRIDIDARKACVTSLAPARGWLDPVILTVIVALLSAGYWLIAHPWIWARLGGG
jgi:hypothetical protein